MTEEHLIILGKIETLVQTNATSVERVINRLEKLDEKVDGIRSDLNTTDSDLKVLKAKGAGILTGVTLIASTVFAIFSERITQLKHFLLG